MKTADFEKELKEINPDLSIRYNREHAAVPGIQQIATITFQGIDIISIPSDEIYENKNESYGVDLVGNGNFIAHRTRPNAIEIVKSVLERLETSKDYADTFFGRGDYSNESLKEDKPKQGDVMVVDTVEGELGEVKSESTFIPNKNA